MLSGNGRGLCAGFFGFILVVQDLKSQDCMLSIIQVSLGKDIYIEQKLKDFSTLHVIDI